MKYRVKRDLTNALLGTTAGSRWKQTVRCYWCGKPVRYHARPNQPNRATKEHLVPISKGGARGGPNVVVACKKCNNTRGNDTTWIPFHLREAEASELEAFTAAVKGVVCDHVWSVWQQEARRRWIRRCMRGCGRSEFGRKGVNPS